MHFLVKFSLVEQTGTDRGVVNSLQIVGKGVVTYTHRARELPCNRLRESAVLIGRELGIEAVELVSRRGNEYLTRHIVFYETAKVILLTHIVTRLS